MFSLDCYLSYCIMDDDPLRGRNDFSSIEGNVTGNNRSSQPSNDASEVNSNIATLLANSDEMQSRQLQRQLILQRQLSRENIRSELSNQDQIRTLLDLNILQRQQQQQQIRGLDYYGTLSGQNAATLGDNVSLQRGMDHSYGIGGTLLPTSATDSISTLLSNIQRRNIEQQALRRHQHRELMSNASSDLRQQPLQHGDRRNLQLNSLLSEASGVRQLSNLGQSQFGTSQLSAILANPSFSQNTELIRSLERSRLLSATDFDYSQISLPMATSLSQTGGRTFDETPSDQDLRQQLMMQEYLRSQQDAPYRQHLLSDTFSPHNDRLALLLQQRQQLEQQSSTSRVLSAATARNVALDSSVPAVTKATSGKISRPGNLETFAQKPKRPLSAYNIFFKEERRNLLSDKSTDETKDGDTSDDKKPAAIDTIVPERQTTKKRKRGKPHHKVSFEEMAKIIGQRWKDLDSDESKKKYYQNLADRDKERYHAELAVWKKERSAMLAEQRQSFETTEADACDGSPKEGYESDR
jgi:HMG-box domain